MARLVLRSPIQRGSLKFDSSLVTVSLATPLLDVNKSIILINGQSNADLPNNFTVVPRIVSTSGITFERTGSSGSDEDIDLNWQVIEFTSGIRVQSIYGNISGSLNYRTIPTAVDLTKAFVILNSSNPTSTTAYGIDDLITARFLNSNTLTLDVYSNQSQLYNAQVVEIDNSTTQFVSGVLGTSGTVNVPISSITANQTFWFFTLKDSITGLANADIPHLKYVNPTTLQFNRYNTSSVDLNYNIFIVSSPNVSIQHISGGLGAVTSGIITIPQPITVNNTAVINNVYHGYPSSSSRTSLDSDESLLAIKNLTTSGFTLARDDLDFPCTSYFQVLEFSTITGSNTIVNIT